MTGSDFKLHKKGAPLPDRLRTARTRTQIDTKTGAVQTHGLPLSAYKKPEIKGITINCERCGAWQELRPVLPGDLEDIEAQAEALGWREVDGEDVCPECVSHGPTT